MPYCPSCEAEYREGVIRCSDCGVELVESLPEDVPPQIDPDAVELTELASFATVAEADMIRELLETNGIRTVVRGESDPIGTASLAAPTTLLVENRDLSRARELYDAFFAGEQEEGEQAASEEEDPSKDVQ